MTDRCTVPRCRWPAVLIYLDRGICAKHWSQLAENRKALRRNAEGVAYRDTYPFRPYVKP